MTQVASLEAAAVRLRIEAQRLDHAVVAYITPVLEQLPVVWRGPAADRLEQQLIDHRTVLCSVAGELNRTSVELEAEAAQLRAMGALPVDEGVGAGAI